MKWECSIKRSQGHNILGMIEEATEINERIAEQPAMIKGLLSFEQQGKEKQINFIHMSIYTRETINYLNYVNKSTNLDDRLIENKKNKKILFYVYFYHDLVDVMY